MPDTQLLYLLRHAKAEPWHPGVIDLDRTLCDRGLHHMRCLARWVKRELPTPEIVLCSPSARTRETLEPFQAVWPDLAAVTRFEPDIYEAGAHVLHELAGNAFENADTLMMVGHNPGFERLALDVLEAPQARRIKKFPTGALAVIEFFAGWEQDVGSGRLKHWVKHKDLDLRD